MRHRLVITDEVEAAIKAELEKIPHASLVARESKGAWSYATVWRVAARAGIELTAGRTTMGRPRLPPEKWAKVEQAVAAHPEASCAPQHRIIWISYLSGALSVFSDFFSVMLPGALLLKIQISKRQKWGLMVIFGVGFLYDSTRFFRHLLT